MPVPKLRMAVVFLLLSFLLALPGMSQGHAFPDHSNPKVGATLTAAPVGVYIWFDGDLEPAFSSIMVHDATGRMVNQLNSRVNPSNTRLLEVGLPPLPAGTYHVMWNVVSRDGHRTSGDFSFTIK
jgi:methionine-rich copper-binding protein CopC